MIARILAWIFVTLALTALGAEVLISIREGGYDALTLSDLWQQFHAKSFIGIEHAFMGTPISWLWDPVALWVLGCPAWIAFGVIGGLLFLRPRRHRRKGVVL